MRVTLFIFALIFGLMFLGSTPVRADDDLVVEDVEDVAVEAEAEEAEVEEEPKDPLLSVFTEDQLETIKQGEESFEFQAEVNRLMDIIINSLYSNREIFVRELISNAADALDKIRYASLTDSSILGDKTELDIKISFDSDARTLTFWDSGVGMTREELKKNLGVVAKSGTTEFVQAATAAKDAGDSALSLIGQFGVGFYSVYLAADRVTVISKNNDDDQYIWESTADRTFSIAKDPRGNTLGRGTQVILHLKDDAEEFLSEGKLKDIVGRYSEFINFPISLEVEKTITEEVEVEDEEGEDVDDESADGDDEEEDEEDEDDDLEITDDDEDDAPKTKTVTKKVKEYEVLNVQKAIWTRSKDDVTEEQYNGFYKSISKDMNDPLAKIHFSAEGEISFRSLLYIPREAPRGLYDKFYEKASNLRLYVRRVLISDEFEDFLPRYLNFVRGVVDSEDLPLNVSRETLAQSRVLKVMSKKLTRKVLEMLRKMSTASEEAIDEAEEADEEDEDEEADASDDASDDGDDEDEDEDDEEDEEKTDDYITFWEAFSKSIKMGIVDDRANKSKLSKLLRYKTSKSDGNWVSLERYVDRMADDQKYIYYITGESMAEVENSPFLEALKAKDFEVLYMTEPLDEYVTQTLTEFDGNQLMSATKEGLKLGEDKDLISKLEKEFETFKDWLKATLSKRVSKIKISNRLASSPCILVTGQYGWSANMERIMKAQTFGDKASHSYMTASKTLEINPRHALIQELKARSEANPDDKNTKDLASLMFDAALLNSGFSMEDKKGFTERIHRILGSSLNVDPNEVAEEYEFPEEEEEEEEEEDEDDVEDLDEEEDDEPVHIEL